MISRSSAKLAPWDRFHFERPPPGFRFPGNRPVSSKMASAPYAGPRRIEDVFSQAFPVLNQSGARRLRKMRDYDVRGRGGEPREGRNSAPAQFPGTEKKLRWAVGGSVAPGCCQPTTSVRFGLTIHQATQSVRNCCHRTHAPLSFHQFIARSKKAASRKDVRNLGPWGFTRVRAVGSRPRSMQRMGKLFGGP